MFLCKINSYGASMWATLTMFVFLHLHAAVINALDAAQATHLLIDTQILYSTQIYVYWANSVRCQNFSCSCWYHCLHILSYKAFNWLIFLVQLPLVQCYWKGRVSFSIKIKHAAQLFSNMPHFIPQTPWLSCLQQRGKRWKRVVRNCKTLKSDNWYEGYFHKTVTQTFLWLIFTMDLILPCLRFNPIN